MSQSYDLALTLDPFNPFSTMARVIFLKYKLDHSTVVGPTKAFHSKPTQIQLSHGLHKALSDLAPASFWNLLSPTFLFAQCPAATLAFFPSFRPPQSRPLSFLLQREFHGCISLAFLHRWRPSTVPGMQKTGDNIWKTSRAVLLRGPRFE